MAQRHDSLVHVWDRINGFLAPNSVDELIGYNEILHCTTADPTGNLGDDDVVRTLSIRELDPDANPAPGYYHISVTVRGRKDGLERVVYFDARHSIASARTQRDGTSQAVSDMAVAMGKWKELAEASQRNLLVITASIDRVLVVTTKLAEQLAEARENGAVGQPFDPRMIVAGVALWQDYSTNKGTIRDETMTSIGNLFRGGPPPIGNGQTPKD